MRSVGPYGSCFDHQQINNHKVRHLAPEIADQITQLTKTPFPHAFCRGKRFNFFQKISQ
jgi:hypothetical protein